MIHVSYIFTVSFEVPYVIKNCIICANYNVHNFFNFILYFSNL
jgi:hypothetical protein